MKNKMTFTHRIRKFFKWWVILIIVILVGVRIALPYVLLKYVNKSLAEMKGYTGHVRDIDIRLIRGAYIIRDIKIYETDNELKKKDTIPFFSSADIHLALDWRSLFHGKPVGVVVMNSPVLNFKNKKSDVSSVKNDTADFRQLLREIMPLTVDYVGIHNGEVHYIDRYSSPPIDIMMNNISASATNLNSVSTKEVLLPSKIIGTGNSCGGTFALNINLDHMNKVPTFDMNAELTGLSLNRINDMLKAYGNFDVTDGIFSVYTEFAGNNGSFKGYVKPLITDLDIVQWNKEEGTVLQIAYESLVAGMATILTNQKKGQFATKVNIEGDFSKTHFDLLTAIKYILINAYIEALKPGLENSIDINNSAPETEKEHKKLFHRKRDKADKTIEP